MKRVLLVIFAIVFLFSSCDKQEMALRKVASINITDARYIFKTSSSTKSLSAEEERFWKVTTKGAVEALYIQDENDKPLEITIDGIWEIGKNYVGIRINYSGNCFIADKRTGKIYTYPSNAQEPHYYLIGRLGFYDLAAIAIEANDKLYLKGEHWHEDNSKYLTGYFVEVDVKNQTSTRCTPDALSAEYIVPAKDGLLAFGDMGDLFIMLPDNSLKKYDADCNACFADKDGNLYIARVTEVEDENYLISIYRIVLQGSTIDERYVCSTKYYHFDPLGLRGGAIFTKNEANGNIIIVTALGALEFDGRELAVIDLGNNRSPLRALADYDGGGYGLMHQYRYEIPRENVFFEWERNNTVSLSHLDLQTYQLFQKEYELFSDSDYTLVEDPSIYQQHIFYSCIRHSDGHVVSFMMDYEGNRTEISDSESSFSIVNFVMIN